VFEGNARCDPLPAALAEMPLIRLFRDKVCGMIATAI